MINFKEGDRVRWTSSANGGTTTKHGVIEHVVPLKTYPERIDPAFYSGGLTRPHQSYLVRVGKTSSAKGKLYWPLVSKLERDV